MGSYPSSLNGNSFSRREDSSMASPILYKNIIYVKTKPWDSQKRQGEFPSEEVQDEKSTFETTIIDVEITHPALTETDCTQKDIFPMPYVNLDNEKEQGFYALTNSKGQIAVSVEPRIPKRNALYTFHVRRKEKQSWDRYHARKKIGDMAVSVEIEQLDIDSVFLTSQLEVQSVEVTREGCTKILDPNDENMTIEFPPESVRSTMRVTVEVTSLDDIIKEKKLEELFGKKHDILGISDMVNVTHEEHFLVPVQLTLPMQPLQPEPDNELPIVLVLYAEDNDIHEMTTATVEPLENNLFNITTDHFCPVMCVRMRPNVRRLDAADAVRYVYELDDPKCNILLFSKKESDGRLLFLRSEIVPEDERLKKEQERTTGLDTALLRNCTSSTIRLKNMDRVRVSLANHMAIKFPKNIPPATHFIVYDRNNNDNSLSFYVEKNSDFGVADMATLEYNLDKGPYRRLLHKATFNALREMRKRTNPTLSRHVSQDTMSRSEGLKRTEYSRQVSVPPMSHSASSGYSSSAGSHVSQEDTMSTNEGLRTTEYSRQLSVPPVSHSGSSGYSSSAGSETRSYDVSLPSIDESNAKIFLDMQDIKQTLKPPSTTDLRQLNRDATKLKHDKPHVRSGAVTARTPNPKKETKPVPTTDTDADSGVFNERSMTLLARQIPDNEYHGLAILLKIPMVDADRLFHSLPNPKDSNQLKLRLLLRWLENESTNPQKRLKTLMDALKDIDQKGLAEKVEEAFNKNEPFKKK